MKHMPALASALALLAACSGGDKADEGAAGHSDPLASAGSVAGPRVADFPELLSESCVDVAQFYFEALGGREWSKAALVWGDPVIDPARLEAIFGGYKEAQITWNEPFVEQGKGALYCTVSGTLIDAKDPAKPPFEGTLLLRRVSDLPGATPEQLRWRLHSSTFVEPLQRSDKSNPA